MAIRPRSIRAKLLVVFVTATVIPMVVLGAIFYASSTHAVAEMAGNRTVRIAQSVRSELDRRLEMRVQDRLLVSNQPVQVFLFEAGAGRPVRGPALDALREYLARLFLQYGDYYDEIVLADPRGEPLVRYERTGASQVRGETSTLPGARTLARDAGPEVPRPANLPPLPGIPSSGAGFRDTDRLLFRAGPGVAAGSFRLHVDPIEAGNAPTVSVLMPVQSNERPEVRLGYLLARIRSRYLWPPDWANRRFGERGELVVVTKVGEEVLYHTRPERIGRRLNAMDPGLSEAVTPVASRGPETWSWSQAADGRRVVTALDAHAAPWKIVATASPGSSRARLGAPPGSTSGSRLWRWCWRRRCW